MSDNVYIPGMSDKFNSGESIRKIMESKKVALTKMEKEKETLQDDKKVWDEVKTKGLNLQSKAKKL